MLSKQQIQQAERNTQEYLREGLLKKTTPNKDILQILIQNSEESLQEAQKTTSALWKIVISYYAMFYAAKAALLQNEYKVGDKIAHKVTSDALIALLREPLSKELLDNYTDIQEQALNTMQADELIQNFEYERKKRGFIQYTTTQQAKDSKAQTSLKRAKEFVLVMKKLITNP